MLSIVALVASGCAGELTVQEIEDLGRGKSGAGGTGVSTTSSSTTTGMGGSGMTDPSACVIALASGPKCSACHSDATHLAGFAFSATSIPNAKQLWVDKSGQGDPPGMMMACGASDKANFKMIDSMAPEMSLMYAKLTDPVPCGMHMPQIGYPLPDADKACMLTWIKSVVAAP